MDAPKDRVLVVDDESNQRTALATMIAGWGYETASAANGAEALDRLREFEASAIVTDLMMPGMDGSELLRRLKDQGQAPPAIVLTAFGNLETAIALVHDLGAFWFLEKPLQPGALRLLLSRAVDFPATKIESGDPADEQSRRKRKECFLKRSLSDRVVKLADELQARIIENDVAVRLDMHDPLHRITCTGRRPGKG